MRTLLSKAIGSASLLLLLSTTGCQSAALNAPSGPSDAGIEYYTPAEQTLIHGYVYDPEAMYWSFFFCPSPPTPCPGGDLPVMDLNTGHFLYSLVAGVNVRVFDPVSGSDIASSFGPTDPYGVWQSPRIPSRTTSPYYLDAFPADAGLLDPPSPSAPPYPPYAPPIPTAGYLPTTQLRGINTSEHYCYIPRTAVMSDSGVLDAVVRYLNATAGPGHTVADFTNPAKYGGVAVIYLFAASPPVASIPASDTMVTSNVGTVLQVSWAPPGAVPPPIAPLQSPRGFFVVPDGAPAPLIGMGVVLLRPSGSPTTVSISGLDTASTLPPAQIPPGRPWTFTPITAAVRPGLISFGYRLADYVVGGPTVVGPFLVNIGPPDDFRCATGGQE